ncbi:uncharacterized protein I303_100670 [Kwoniella dejecticola CBS 10117]|uniref:Uncharacterized protein n=1 Tax=Kwoniella dejecticola CBS 10117 TaxID=1296121 RepID=A0A1A6AFK4_9TREE|nr:uncharacterized protein I303_00674 [Kwoniella dejecticola CBS 10117]OBR88857.1 hypothetical protein I303_00674 [Kwoniella dejecticola CBS 10117]
MPSKRPRAQTEAFIENIDMLEEEIKPLIPSSPPSTPSSSSTKSPKDVKPTINHKATINQTPTRGQPSPKSTLKKKVKVEYNTNGSAKARFAEIILEQGLRSYDKTFVEAETGFTKAQQMEMLKKGRGSLWKALYGFASTL